MLQKKPENTAKKIFCRSLKAYGHKVCSFYIIDVLLSAKAALSIAEIRKKVYQASGTAYSIPAFETSINCLANMATMQLHVSEVKEGRTIIKKFSLTINNTEK